MKVDAYYLLYLFNGVLTKILIYIICFSEIQIFAKDHVEKGEPINIHCNATGVLEELDWFRNGYKIETNFDKGIFIEKTVHLATKTISSTLHVVRSEMKDSGTYTCRTSARQVKSFFVTVLSGKEIDFIIQLFY